jgi:DNA gyrase/topoisomerase IV subunit A
VVSGFPNLLVNGADMIPPHNLGEIVAAVAALRVDPDVELTLPGPDFPTGGVLVTDPSAAYETGKGSVLLRARTEVGDGSIAITELPYGVEKGGDEGIISQIVEVIVDGRLPEVVDVQDLSDRQRMRLQIVLTDDALPESVLSRLWESTQLEVAVGIDLGRPLRQVLRSYCDLDRGQFERIAAEHGDARRTAVAF